MYRVLGADGKEYGPVTGDVLRQWISEGRANAQTQVKPEGGTQWQTLSSVPEFEPAFAAAAGAAPTQPLAGAPGPGKTSALAITSLVLGILGLFTCGVTSLVGLILGIVALVKVSRSGGQLSGKGLAIAGICTSGLFLLMVPIYAAMLLPALARAKAKAQTINCLNNVKQLNLGVMTYAQANGDKFPTADQWCDAILKQVGSEKVFRCPGDSQGNRSDYAFNQKLGGLPMNKVTSPSQTVLIFESDGGWNQSGGRELAVRHPRHLGRVIVGFADGHAESVLPSRLRQLVWDPDERTSSP
jgi:prepilin-type processing-associated H-X9-DG protein